MSNIASVLGSNTGRDKHVPEPHHGARDALAPLGLAKMLQFFRKQQKLADGIDADAELFGTSAGYDLRVGRANELEPLLRSALPIERGSLDGPDRATLARALAGVGRGGTTLSDDDKGKIAPAMAAVRAAKAQAAWTEVEGGGNGEKRKREKKEKKEKKEKRRRRESEGGGASQGGNTATTSQGGVSAMSTGSDKTAATGKTGEEA